METPRGKFESIANTYIFLFAEKHGLHFDGWVAGRTGEIAYFFGNLFFHFDDIRLDVDNNVPYALIKDRYSTAKSDMNFRTYLMGKVTLTYP